MRLFARALSTPTRSIFLLIALGLATPSAAQQLPNYDANRWSGFTAIAPPQGFVQGSPLTLTWGFMLDGTAINLSGAGEPFAASNLKARLNTIYGSQAVWQTHFQSVFDRWSSLSGLSYQFEANDDGATITANSSPGGVLGVRADIRIGGKPIDGDSGVLAYNYFPNWGEMVIDTNDSFFNNTGGNSIGLRNTVAHEHGHGVGMDHINSNNAAFLLEPTLNTGFDGPQYHDILAVQRMYGDKYEKVVTPSGPSAGQGNDVAGRATALGAIGSTPLKIGQRAKAFLVASTATDFVSIDDQTDTDFYSFDVGTAGQVTIDLEALGFAYNVTRQGGGGATPFDSRLRSDLALALLDTNGSTILASSNVSGLGGAESIFFNLLSGGRYFVLVTGIDNADALNFDVQFYGLSISFAPVPEPATWAMIGIAAMSFGGWRRLRRGLFV